MSTSELNDIVRGVHAFVDSVVVPMESANSGLLEDPRSLYGTDGKMVGAARALRREVRMRSAEAGYYTLFASTDLGGAGLGMRALFTIWESLYHRCGPGRILPYDAIGHWTSGPGLILENVSQGQAPDVVDDVMSGRKMMCFGMSEPDAGSDAWAIRTRATPDGNDWRLSGTKQWTTNGPTADFILVFAVTDDVERRTKKGGITAFLVPMNSPGVSVDSVVKLFGEIGGKEAIVSFNDTPVRHAQIVGEIGQGMRLGLSGVGIGRIYNAARGVGLGRWALERSIAYADIRTTFGAKIGDNQGIQFPLAETGMELYAASTMALDCADRLDSGIASLKELAMVKAYATETWFRAFDRAIQVHGGMGLTNEVRLVDGFMQARIARIADGSAEMMRRAIWRELQRGDVQIGARPR
jgi:acyl-CoA dehydrogenase